MIPLRYSKQNGFLPRFASSQNSGMISLSMLVRMSIALVVDFRIVAMRVYPFHCQICLLGRREQNPKLGGTPVVLFAKRPVSKQEVFGVVPFEDELVPVYPGLDPTVAVAR
jgi:hypothetical protein